MLTSEISLWSGGPTLTLGTFLICWKYAFAFAFLCWASSLLRWSSRGWMFGGALALATLGAIGVGIPLERPYGLVDGGAALSELAMPMVTVERGTASESWLVAQSNPSPLWSLVIAAASGFDARRLLSLYRWIPVVVQIFFAVALLTWMSVVEPDRSGRRFGPGLAVFFALFLSEYRLGFLETDANLWTDALWLRPRIAFAMGLLFLFCALFGSAQRLWSFAAAGVGLALIGWTEPRFALVGALGALACEAGRWRPGKGITKKSLASLLVPAGLFAWVPVVFLPSTPSMLVASRSWLLLWNGLCAVTLDRGLVLVAAVYGGFEIARRERSRSSDLLLALTSTSFGLYALTLFSARTAAWLDRELLETCLSVLLAVLAGLGASSLVGRIGSYADEARTFTGRLAKQPAECIVLVALVAGSLPWCFPYWWYPARMDAAYQASLVPVSRQRLEFTEWIRRHTGPDAVFAAGPSYAPWIGALAGRRLLWIDDAPARAEARGEAQETLLESPDPAEVRATARSWGVTHFAWGRLDGELPRTIESFRPLYQQRQWVTVYAAGD